MIELPVVPTVPAAGATAAEWDVYLRIVALHINAASVAATNASAAAHQAVATSQHALASAIGAAPPQRLPTRAELVFEMVKDQPQATVLTPAVVVKGAADIVDAYVARYPGAVSG